MKICLYTDNHFSKYSSIIRRRGNKFSKRLENQIQSLNWVEQLAQDKHCSQIICLGDFFDSPDLKAEELTALQEIKWASNIDHIFIVGNHEMSTQDAFYNSTKVLSKYGKVIDKPTMDCGFGYELILLPYILESNRKPLSFYVSELYKDYYSNMFTTQEVKQRIILSHNDLAGIRYGQFESKSGFNIEDIMNSCQLFINGHLHNQQQINEKILNLGNLTGQNFSEDATKYSHCAAILDTDTLKVELINNPYAFKFYKFEILEESDFNKLNMCDNFSIATIKIKENLKEKLINFLPPDMEYRTIIIPNIIQREEDTPSTIESIDHIDKFKNYVKENIEVTDTLLDELAQL